MTDITLPLRLHMYMYIYLYSMYWWTQLAAYTCTYSRSKIHNRTVNDPRWRHLMAKVHHRDTAYNWTPDMHNSLLYIIVSPNQTHDKHTTKTSREK